MQKLADVSINISILLSLILPKALKSLLPLIKGLYVMLKVSEFGLLIICNKFNLSKIVYIMI